MRDKLTRDVLKALERDARLRPEKVAALEFMQGTVTHFLLKRYKKDGEVQEGHERLERLPVTP